MGAVWLHDQLIMRKFQEFTGDTPVVQITKRLIDQYLGERSKEIMKSSVNVELRHLKAALTKAVDWNYLPENPAKGLKPLQVPVSAPRFFTETQAQTILSAIDFEPMKEIVIFAVNTGARLGEVLNVRWMDIDSYRKTVRIAQTETFSTKTKRERTIPLNDSVYDLLAGMERRGEYVFCRLNGRQRDKHWVSRKFKSILVSIGLGKGYSFHSLRHTFASWLVQKGVSIYKVSKLLGHSNVKTTEIYAYLAPETFHPEVNLLDYENPRDRVVEMMEEAGRAT